MKRFNRPLYLYFIVVITLLLSCKGSGNSTKNQSYGKATEALIDIVNKDAQLKSLLIASIQKAKEINPDTISNPAQSLEEYYDFVSKVEQSMPWEFIHKDKPSSTLEHIFQSLGSFYFIIDQPLPALKGKGLFHNSLQYYKPFASWLTKFNKSWQKYLDSEKSWNEEYYRIFLSDSAFGLQNGWYEDPSNWKTFNQFFARRLRSAAARPIASPGDNSVVISPVDGVPQGVWTIDSTSSIVVKGGVAVKSANIKQITKLLGDDSQYKNAFANGTFTHSFLNINDYHRYHFPMSGTIKEIRIIQGINPSGGVTTWNARKKRYELDPSSVDWQMLETRGCVILKTEKYGLVALLPIGMAVVGSVNFESHLKVGQKVNKGDMLGYFLFGGSDFIIIFQDKVKFELEAPKQGDNNSYSHLLMGERLGHLTLRQ